MNINQSQPLHSTYLDHSSKQTSFASKILVFLYETPAESVAFFVGAAAMRLFMRPLALPLVGIGASLLVSKLVLKILNHYNKHFVITLTKETCKFNKNYPKLQLIAFIFTMAISLLSPIIGLTAGIALGSFGAVILDVERYKLIQQSNRKDYL